MTKQEWLEKATEHKDKLVDLIDNYHPASHAIHVKKSHDLPITAPSAESASRIVREKINKEESGLAYPRDRFQSALAAGDWLTIYSLLNGAWFGVPESTACWQVRGFKEAVDLMEDLPEEEEEAEEEDEQEGEVAAPAPDHDSYYGFLE
jgi:hypothetical protein